MSQPPPIPPRNYLSTMESPSLNNFLQQSQGYGQPFAGYGNYQPYSNPYSQGNFYGTPASYATNYSNPQVLGFVRHAEESSKSAFQSVDQVVNAFVSVANMLNSSHTAVFNSFRAIIGVVEQFRVLKEQVISVFIGSLFQWLRFLWRKLLSVLRMKPRNYASSEAIWTGIQEGGADGKSIFGCGTLLFWLVALAGPYLIYRYVSQMLRSAEESRKWATGETEHYTAKVLYNFVAANANELSVSAGDMLRVAPKSAQPNIRDWVLAAVISAPADKQQPKIGLVPINYVKLIGRESPSQKDVARASHSSSTDSLCEANERDRLRSVYESAFSFFPANNRANE